MKIKLDENLSMDHAEIFKSFGHDVKSVHEQGISGCSDEKLWQVVSEEKMFFVTLDIDFSDIRKFQLGSHSGILLIRTDMPGRINVSLILKRVLSEINLETLKGCLAVADETKTRVRSKRL
ncbi:MAG: hypothetical protein AUJ85_10995 [Elusimicrobia bacterium CG1_02_37_114]|nr:MAG: hypothetical protein AUJ85_10995 [Elusimicrobia bacterium CG1_02_37_114]PIV53760.1 MAG: hypothetical protein COS17_02325 [Elusimicrobia bacterium CG02_land_8_20_14_3_00_37_13]PIZ12727.1 MAG: hypothetical protein COY53_08535 [Elusimicrobia bacterium CG_4_10_14_0_8_um_filter_37_32]